VSRSRTDRADDGFSLVEVVVAIGIVVVVMVAVLPQMVNGIRAGAYARVSTQGKTMITSELELMRNLPFQVQPNAGQYVDLFDRYFQDLVPPTDGPDCRDGDLWMPPPSEASGFVSESGERCSYEPSGPFYRIVRRASGPDIKGIKPDPDLEDLVVVVDTQFLKPSLDTDNRPQVAAPLAGYDTKLVGKDTPASGLVGVTVTVMADQPSRQRPLTTYSQISRSYQTTTRVRAISDSVALEAQTMLPGPTEREGNVVAISGGLAHLEASLVTASRVDAAAAATTATAATGENAGTARTAFSAPPDLGATWSPRDAGSLTTAGCALACWGGGEYSGTWRPTTTNGLPGIGSPTNPLEVALKAPSASEGDALRMGSGTNPLFRPELALANPILKLRSSDFTYGITST
jgi:prepilin-type N-terminal cleavage/methylation domain-containing protein